MGIEGSPVKEEITPSAGDGLEFQNMGDEAIERLSGEVMQEVIETSKEDLRLKGQYDSLVRKHASLEDLADMPQEDYDEQERLADAWSQARVANRRARDRMNLLGKEREVRGIR